MKLKFTFFIMTIIYNKDFLKKGSGEGQVLAIFLQLGQEIQLRICFGATSFSFSLSKFIYKTAK